MPNPPPAPAHLQSLELLKADFEKAHFLHRIPTCTEILYLHGEKKLGCIVRKGIDGQNGFPPPLLPPFPIGVTVLSARGGDGDGELPSLVSCLQESGGGRPYLGNHAKTVWRKLFRAASLAPTSEGMRGGGHARTRRRKKRRDEICGLLTGDTAYYVHYYCAQRRRQRTFFVCAPDHRGKLHHFAPTTTAVSARGGKNVLIPAFDQKKNHLRGIDRLQIRGPKSGRRLQRVLLLVSPPAFADCRRSLKVRACKWKAGL